MHSLYEQGPCSFGHPKTTAQMYANMSGDSQLYGMIYHLVGRATNKSGGSIGIWRRLTDDTG